MVYWGPLVAIGLFLLTILLKPQPKLKFFPASTGPRPYFSFQIDDERWRARQEKHCQRTWLFLRFVVQNTPNAKALITNYTLKIPEFGYSSDIKPRAFNGVRMLEGERASIRNCHSPTSFNTTTGGLVILPQTGGLTVELPFCIPYDADQMNHDAITVRLILRHGSALTKRKYIYTAEIKKL